MQARVHASTRPCKRAAMHTRIKCKHSIKCKHKCASLGLSLIGPVASTTMQAMCVLAAHLAHTPVPEACSLAINDALQAYLDEGGNWDFGEYNTILRQKAVVCAELLRCKPIIIKLLGPIPSGRMRTKQMELCIQQVVLLKGKHIVFPEARNRRTLDVARAVTTCLVVIFAHLRRLRNENQFRQATAHMPQVGSKALKALVDMLQPEDSPTQSEDSPSKTSDSSLFGKAMSDSAESMITPTKRLTEVPMARVKLSADGWPETDSDASMKEESRVKLTAEGWPETDSDASMKEESRVKLTAEGWPVSDSDSSDQDSASSDQNSACCNDLKSLDADVDTFLLTPKRNVSKNMEIDILAGATHHRKELEQCLLEAPLPGGRDAPKHQVVAKRPASHKTGQKRKRSTNPTATTSLGEIKLECYNAKSYIRVYTGGKWKLLVNLEGKRCAEHQTIMKQVFEVGTRLDQDAVAMKAHRDALVQEANGKRRAVVHEDSDAGGEDDE